MTEFRPPPLVPLLVQSRNWLFDFFAIAYDYLDVYLQLPLWEGPSPPALDEAWNQTYDQDVENNVINALETDMAVKDEVWNYLGTPHSEDLCRNDQAFLFRLFVVLQIVDRACTEANPFAHSRTHRPGMQEIRARYDETRHLTKNVPGTVAFYARTFHEDALWWVRAERTPSARRADTSRYSMLPARGQHLARFFSNLCRVHPIQGCEVDFAVIDAMDCPRFDFDRRLTIGVVPLVETLELNAGKGSSEVARLRPGPLKLRVVENSESRCSFTIEIAGQRSPDQACRILADRAENAILTLIKHGAQIAVFPELVVPDPVVERIKRVMSKNASGPLELVVAGTFLRDAGPNGKPYNEAIILGPNPQRQELWRQRKLHRYEMQPYEQERCSLDRAMPKRPDGGLKPAIEDVATHPRRLIIRDGGRERFAVLICEDLGQSLPGFHVIEAFRVNFLFVPVMALALKRDRSFATAASRLSHEIQTIVTVANSGPLAQAEWGKARKGDSTYPPLGLVSVPLWDEERSDVSTLSERIPVPGGGFVHIFYCPDYFYLTEIKDKISTAKKNVDRM